LKTKTFKRHRKRVQKLLDSWILVLGLAWYHIEVIYYDNDRTFRKENGDNIIMRAWVDWRYMTIIIAVNVPSVKGLSNEKLEHIVVHELCHALVNEMRETGIDHEERVVTMLTKAFLWTRDLTKDIP
jgi:hypothetical protein